MRVESRQFECCLLCSVTICKMPLGKAFNLQLLQQKVVEFCLKITQVEL